MHALDPFLPSRFTSLQQKIPVDKQGNSWLHFAAKEIQFSSEKILLIQHIQKILDIHPFSCLEKNVDEISPFKIALIFRDYRLISLFFFQLLKNTSPEEFSFPLPFLNEKNSHGETVLHLACLKQDYEIAFRLIEWGADPESLNDYDENFLHYLVANSVSSSVLNLYKDQLSRILADRPSLIYQLNCHRQTPLKMALDAKNTGFILLFLDCGVDKNTSDPSEGTLIYQAVAYQNKELFNELMKRECDINLPSLGGWVPLHLAIAQNSVDFVRSLISSKKVDFSILCIYQQNFLHYAINFYRFDIVNILCEYPEVMQLLEQKDLFGQTPMDLILKTYDYYCWLVDFHQISERKEEQINQEILEKLLITKEKIEKIISFFEQSSVVLRKAVPAPCILAQEKLFPKIKYWLNTYFPEEQESLSFLESGMCAGLSLLFLFAAKKNRLDKFFDRLTGSFLTEKWISDVAFFQHHFSSLKLQTTLNDRVFHSFDFENSISPQCCVIQEALATRHPSIAFIIVSKHFCHMFSVYRCGEEILLFDANMPYRAVSFFSDETAAEAIVQHINFQTNGMLKLLKIQFIDLPSF